MTRSKIAVQLYTVREHTKTRADLADSLRKIAAIGYKAVQFSAVGAMNGDVPEVSVTQAKEMLDANGLACIATHRSWDEIAERTDETIDFHRALGCSFTAIGGIPQSYGAEGANGYKRFVDEAAPVIARLKAAGIGFGHHNHAHEFRKIDNDGTTLFDILIERGGPDYGLEIDLYWAWHAGVDPAQLVARCAGRVPVLHLKDKEVIAEQREPVMAPIGEGNLPWNTILPACQAAGTQWYAVEQDQTRRDPFDCLRSSFEFLQRQGL